ncbi:unnamed protein product [Peniophora sp. CBMAI 1063]|nr:unnamed protein product [Peniophora sp. CBMAI 1063]
MDHHDALDTDSPFLMNAMDDDDHDPRAALDDDADTASARSISLSSPSHSRKPSAFDFDTHVDPYGGLDQHTDTNTISTTDNDRDDASFARTSSVTSPEPSTYGAETYSKQDMLEPSDSAATVTYPPPPLQPASSRESVQSFATSGSSRSRKARPESMLPGAHDGPIVLGIALVDFNHLVGPRIEFSEGDVFEDEEIAKILPFLALPDGAHLSSEDYSYFHLVPVSPTPTTVFGISCNRQIATSALLVKEPDMTRSTVQKAVVVLASKPVFGPIRDRLGVITEALFEQKDFTDKSILSAFHESLEPSLRSQLTESGLYMGTNLQELVRQFRHRTLVLVKALMLQRKLMFYGHPVEKLCTYQYSLVSLFPGLLQTLEDSGSPPLASRAAGLSGPPSTLKTSDRKSMLQFVGFPLDLFGKNAFFQPYLPLQQLDLIKSQTQSFLCGSTNSIVTQSKDIELLVNIETGAIEFRDPKVERICALTAADRKWVDEVVRDVTGEEGARGMQFKGSDDYMRQKFEEYIQAALSSVKYGDFLAKGQAGGVIIADAGDANAQIDFNPLWIAEFKRTNAYEVWNRVTDPMLFDIVEPRHPCGEKPSAIADIGLRLSEGIQDLKLEQQLAPAREAVSRTFAAGSKNFFSAVEGVRGRWAASAAAQKSPPTEVPPQAATTTTSPPASSAASTSTIEVITKSEAEGAPPVPAAPLSPDLKATVSSAGERLSTWGAGIGSFFARQRGPVSPGGTVPPSPNPEAGPSTATLAQPTPAPASATPSRLSSPPTAGGSKLKSFRMSTHGSVLNDPSLDALRRPTSPGSAPATARARSFRMSSTSPRPQSVAGGSDSGGGGGGHGVMTDAALTASPRGSASALSDEGGVSRRTSGESAAAFGMAV